MCDLLQKCRWTKWTTNKQMNYINELEKRLTQHREREIKTYEANELHDASVWCYVVLSIITTATQ